MGMICLGFLPLEKCLKARSRQILIIGWRGMSCYHAAPFGNKDEGEQWQDNLEQSSFIHELFERSGFAERV
jgi:hypothetical protein